MLQDIVYTVTYNPLVLLLFLTGAAGHWLSTSFRVKHSRVAYTRLQKVALFHLVTVGTFIMLVSIMVLHETGILVLGQGLLSNHIASFMFYLPSIFYVLLVSFGQKINVSEQ